MPLIHAICGSGSCIVVGCTECRSANLWRMENKIIGLCNRHLTGAYDPIVNIFVYSYLSPLNLKRMSIIPRNAYSATLWKYNIEFTGQIARYDCSVATLKETKNRKDYQNGIVMELDYIDFLRLINYVDGEFIWTKPRLLSIKRTVHACALIPRSADNFKKPTREYLQNMAHIQHYRRVLMADYRADPVRIQIKDPENGKKYYYKSVINS